MNWHRSDRADPLACRIADRHYNRQKPGTPQFVPPGRCFVLRLDSAVWVTSWPFAQYVKHAWPGAWINSCFRRESGPQASVLIREAVAATRWHWPDIPALGMVTFINVDKIRARREGWGKCYIKAGFKHVGETKGGLMAFQLLPEDMPEAIAPLTAQLLLEAQSA